MAYNNQKTDFANNLKVCNEAFINSLNTYRNLKKYYDSVLTIADGDDLGNGITGAEIKAVITSLSAVEAFLTDNFHYTNLNKIR